MACDFSCYPASFLECASLLHRSFELCFLPSAFLQKRLRYLHMKRLPQPLVPTILMPHGVDQKCLFSSPKSANSKLFPAVIITPASITGNYFNAALFIRDTWWLRHGFIKPPTCFRNVRRTSAANRGGLFAGWVLPLCSASRG